MKTGIRNGYSELLTKYGILLYAWVPEEDDYAVKEAKQKGLLVLK